MQHQMRNVLDTDKVGRLLFQLATPAFFGMFVQTMYNVVNTIFIGHIKDGANAIAGLSIVFPIQMLVMGMGMMVGMGGTSMISRFLGSRDNEKAEKTLGNGLTASIILALAFTAIILPNINWMLRLLGASDAVLPYASKYLIIVIAGTLPNLLGMSFLNYIRAEGNARVPMIANIMGAGLNIILDYIFIIVLDMNVTGAALGTVIAQTVTLCYLASFYISKSSYLRFHKQYLKLDPKILKPMFAIGVSSLVQTAAGSISSIFLINAVVTYGGDIYLASFGIIQRIMMFATMPAMVIGQGAQPILGFNYGAKRFDLATKAFRLAAIWGTALSLVGFVLIYAIPGPITSIFTTDQALIDATILTSRFAFIGMPIMGFMMLGTNSFMSLGKAVQAFITALARPALFMLPAVLILPNFWGINGVFAAFPASDILTLFLTIILLIPIFREFRRGAKKNGSGLMEPVSVKIESTERN
jgi:putative MATE family efflux protein